MKNVKPQIFRTPLRAALSLIAPCLVLFSCVVRTPEPGTPTEAYAVTGTVVDTKGVPMAGVKVRADNSVQYGSTEVTTDQQGRYKLPKLEIGSWKVYAWKEVNYKGKTYHLRLGMPAAADYDAVSPGKDGVVKNFRWQLSGQIPDRPRSDRSGSGYFGGTLLFRNLGPDASTMAAGTVVIITLTPVAGATLFDGSTPAVIKKSFTIEAGEYNYWVHDIAQCEYRITAEAKLNGSNRQVLLSKSVSSGHAAAIEGFYFKPHLGSSGDYENGLLTTNDDPFFIY